MDKQCSVQRLRQAHPHLPALAASTSLLQLPTDVTHPARERAQTSSPAQLTGREAQQPLPQLQSSRGEAPEPALDSPGELRAVRKSHRNLGSSSIADPEGSSKGPRLPTPPPAHLQALPPAAPAKPGAVHPPGCRTPCSQDIPLKPTSTPTPAMGASSKRAFPPKNWAPMLLEWEDPQLLPLHRDANPTGAPEKLPQRARLLRGGVSGRELSPYAASG